MANSLMISAEVEPRAVNGIIRIMEDAIKQPVYNPKSEANRRVGAAMLLVKIVETAAIEKNMKSRFFVDVFFVEAYPPIK